MTELHTQMMALAIAEAQKATAVAEVPVGAVLYHHDGTIIAQAHNLVESRQDATAHAELLCLQAAGTKVLTAYTLAVTLEPCAMCAQAMAWAQLGTLRFGAYDVKSGGVINGARVFQHSHHKPEVYGGMAEAECTALLQDFFAKRRS